MTEREAFIRQICERPDDDTVRLVFADWLQENGEPERAEFIRDQIEWRFGSSDFDLLDANWDVWFPDVTRHDENGFRRLQNYGGGLAAPLLSGNTVIFSRGFVSAVRFSATVSYMKHANEGYWRQQPITEVRLVDKTPWFNHDKTHHGWWSESALANPLTHPDVMPLPLMIHMASDPDRFDHGIGNRFTMENLVGCIMWNHRNPALAAASRACVAHGRALANLPPLSAKVPA